MMINLISDTVTKPTVDMLDAMMTAKVGDDVFGEDPTVNQLEEKVAALFGKEAALFCPSGTMANQISIKLNTQPLEEIICDRTSHIFYYETAAYAMISNTVMNPIWTTTGKLSPNDITDNIKPLVDWLPYTSMVGIENSCNRAGGLYYTFDEMKSLSEVSRANGLKIHLDGARIFNVLVETGDQPQTLGPLFETISTCLSKGLGAPVGSLIISSKANIAKARRLRKALGGGMRQVGILAAAGLYALDNHVDRLKEDNEKARIVGTFLKTLSYVTDIKSVQTNIVIFTIDDRYSAQQFLDHLRSENVLATAFGKNMIRFVFHLDIKNEMMENILKALQTFC